MDKSSSIRRQLYIFYAAEIWKGFTELQHFYLFTFIHPNSLIPQNDSPARKAVPASLCRNFCATLDASPLITTSP
jgi:hypothetical protein